MKIDCWTNFNNMAKKRCYFMIILPGLITFCFVKPTCMANTAQTPSQVISLLSSYSSSMNHTVGKRFLKDVRDSEVGLCLNLSNAQNRSFFAEIPLVTIHVRLANYSSVANTHFQFPCSTCSTLLPRSPLVELILNNDTLPDVSCLAASRFSDDFGSVSQNISRISDVLSLSFFDRRNSMFINLSTSDVIKVQIPLARTPNNSFHYTLECHSREWRTFQWSNISCSTNQTIKMENGSPFVQCKCSTLGFLAVFVRYIGEPLPEGPTIPTTSISLKLDADCQFYLSNMTVKANFLNTTKYSIAIALNTSVSNIKNMEAECGSIVVNFTLVSHDGTNEALKRAALKFGNLVTSDLFKVIMDDTQIFPFTLRVFGVNMSETFVSPYFHRKFATTPTTQPTEIQPLVIDYKPFMIAVSVVSVAVIACVCCTCCSHSWYLRKKKYTEFNSDKVVPKVEVPVVEEEEEEEEVAPPEFPMTYTKRPKVDERRMSKYDWARTSFTQEQNNLSVFVTPQGGQGPRLMVDCGSDEESDGGQPSVGESEATETRKGIEIDSGSAQDVPSDSEDERPKSCVSEELEVASESLSHGQKNVTSESRGAVEEAARDVKHNERQEKGKEEDSNQAVEDHVSDVHDQHVAEENDEECKAKQSEDGDKIGTNDNSEGSPINEGFATPGGSDASSKPDAAVITNGGMPEPCM